MCAVRTDGVSEQHAAQVANLALGLRTGGQPGHQPQQPHLHVSLPAAHTQAAGKRTQQSDTSRWLQNDDLLSAAHCYE